MNGPILTVTMVLINFTLGKPFSDMITDKNQINLEMDIVDLGDGNGNNPHQLQLSEFVDTMELEDSPMEFHLYVGWILVYYFVDMKKDKLIVGQKYHKYLNLLLQKWKEILSLMKTKHQHSI